MTLAAPTSWMKSSRLYESHANESRSVQKLVDGGWVVVRDLVASFENPVKNHTSRMYAPMVVFIDSISIKGVSRLPPGRYHWLGIC